MSNKKTKRGFTLIEIILVILVVGCVTFIAAPLIDSAIESWSFVTYRSELWQSSELAFLRMSTDIKEIRGSSDVIAADAQTFRFITIGGEDVTYSLAGGTLNRNGIALISGLDAFSFSYFDHNMNEIESPAISPMVTDIKIVRLYMVNGPTGSTFAMQTDVHPRNID